MTVLPIAASVSFNPEIPLFLDRKLDGTVERQQGHLRSLKPRSVARHMSGCTLCTPLLGGRQLNPLNSYITRYTTSRR